MKKYLKAAAFLGLCIFNVQASPVVKNDSLHWKVFTTTRPGLTRDPDMPAVNDSLKKVTNTSTLIFGKKDAVLIDVFLTIDQAKALADSVAATGKNLTYIYITHPHGDHFFGLQLLLDRFPNAKAIATQAVVDGCMASIQPDVVSKFWAPKFPGQIPSKLAVPTAIKGNEFELEGKKIMVIEDGLPIPTIQPASMYRLSDSS